MIKKINKKGRGVSPVVSAIAGTVLGAGVAIAGAIVLSRKENKKKVEEVISKVKTAAGRFVQKAKDESQNKKEEVRSAAIDVVDSIDKLADKTKKQIKRI